jgi:hypothetical protein
MYGLRGSKIREGEVFGMLLVRGEERPVQIGTMAEP